jgi:hypothetical protein
LASINNIIQVTQSNIVRAVSATNLTTMIICGKDEVQDTVTANSVVTFNSYVDFQTNYYKDASSSDDLDAIARAWFLNGGGRLKVFVSEVEDPDTAYKALIEKQEFFNIVVYSKKIIIPTDSINSIATSITADGDKVFAYTANEDEYEAMHAALSSLPSVVLSFASKATQAADKINSYLFVAVGSIFGQINRDGVNTSINVENFRPNGFRANADLEKTLAEKITTNKTLHVDSTQVGDAVSPVFFQGNRMMDGRIITIHLNYIALKNSLQVDGLNNIASLSYDVNGFGSAINIAVEVLQQYFKNGSLSKYTPVQLANDESLRALDPLQQTSLIDYGFAVLTKASEFNPSADETESGTFPQIDVVAKFAFGASKIKFDFFVKK